LAAERRQQAAALHIGRTPSALIGIQWLLCLLIGTSCVVACNNTAANNDLIDRDRTSLRALAAALESYCVDWSRYPARLDDLTIGYTMASGKISPYVQNQESIFPIVRDPRVDSIPVSAFDGTTTPRYVVTEKFLHFWLLRFPGPDGDWDLDSFTSRSLSSSDAELPFQPEIVNLIYDPTNGDFANGDIVRWKQ
jgi:hypothetical protein